MASIIRFHHYCKGVLALIEGMQPKSAFELAIGTGYPYVQKLLADGIYGTGCDIPWEVIAELERSSPAINACVGGYYDLASVEA